MSNAAESATTLRLERVIRADRQRVYDAWTQPEIMAKWSAPEGLTIADGSMDLRPGGKWHVVMAAPNGERHEAFGTYREVTPPSRLVYSHAWRTGTGSSPETTLTIEFIAEGKSTRVVLTQVGFASADDRDSHKQGWSSALDNLEKLFSAKAG